MVDQVRLDGTLQDYILTIIQKTRASKWLELGVSPRGTLALQRAAQAAALLDGRDYCTPDDIKPLAMPVLAHRVIARAETFTDSATADAEKVIQTIVNETPVPL